MPRVKDLTGMRFGRLTVLELCGFDKRHLALWKCKCDCGNEKVVLGTRMTKGETSSCGCYAKELQSLRQSNYSKGNEYEIVGKIARVKLSNCDDYFICDADDWEKLKHLTWGKTSQGYVRNSKRSGEVRIQNLIMNPHPGKVVDHIDGNKLNNCRSNLRVVTIKENCQNKHYTKSKTGVIGVRLFPNGKYGAQIKCNGHDYYLGRFDTLEEAAKARKQKEIELNYGNLNQYIMKGEK